jgi:hypothetical protein
MPMLSTELAEAETRVRGLKQKIALRQSQQTLGMSEGVAFGRSDQFITALYAELHKAAAVVVSLKYDPVVVIERMEAPPHVCPTPAAPVVRPPTDEDVRAALQKLFTMVPETATVKSLKELIAS